MKAAPRNVLVIGLGNPERGDDGVGPLVAKKLAALLPADVAVASPSGDVLNLITTWAGFDAVICIDAAAALSAPGRIHRFDLAASELPGELASISTHASSHASSHSFGLAEAIGLARALQQAPRDIVIYAIEGASFAVGAPITPEVAAAAVEVTGRVAAEVGRLRRNSPTNEPRSSA
jgi:hydrogenase maturation protease